MDAEGRPFLTAPDLHHAGRHQGPRLYQQAGAAYIKQLNRSQAALVMLVIPRPRHSTPVTSPAEPQRAGEHTVTGASNREDMIGPKEIEKVLFENIVSSEDVCIGITNTQ